jgi:hypothetical protein
MDLKYFTVLTNSSGLTLSEEVQTRCWDTDLLWRLHRQQSETKGAAVMQNKSTRAHVENEPFGIS